MYDDELDTVLEDAYNDGYYQALLDMDTYDDAIEDADMYDDYDYDEAMEGPAREYRKKMNAGKTREEIHSERKYKKNYDLDPKYSIGKHHDASGRRHFNSKKAHDYYINTRRRNRRDKYLKYFLGGTGTANFSKLYSKDSEKLREKYADKKAMAKFDEKYGHTIDESGLDPIAKEALRRKYKDKYRETKAYKDAYTKHYAKAEALHKKINDNMSEERYSRIW